MHPCSIIKAELSFWSWEKKMTCCLFFKWNVTIFVCKKLWWSSLLLILAFSSSTFNFVQTCLQVHYLCRFYSGKALTLHSVILLCLISFDDFLHRNNFQNYKPCTYSWSADQNLWKSMFCFKIDVIWVFNGYIKRRFHRKLMIRTNKI